MSLQHGGTRFTLPLAVQGSAAVVLLGLVISRGGEWNIVRWAGLIIAIPSAALLVWARYQLGNSFSITPQARELITHGLYSKIRNPMYVFSGLLVLGLLIAYQKPYYFLLFVVLLPVQIIRARQEAKVLEAKFGAAYREYRKKTWF